MRKRTALVFMMLLIAFGAQGVAAQGNGHKPFNETVYVDGTWQETGIVVKGGITISATGTFNCDAIPDDPNTWPDCVNTYGPNGLTGSSANGAFDFVAPGLPMYSLVGRFGDGDPFFVGEGPTTVLGDGVLYLAINDNVFTDNDGGFTVTVTSCRPGNGNGDTNHCHFGAPGQN